MKIVRKAVCASALMVPLALPIAAQAQDVPPVTMSAVPAAEYQDAYVQSTPGLLYNNCLQTNTDYAFVLDTRIRLTGAYSGYFDARNEGGYAVSFSPAAINSAEPTTFPATVSFRTPATTTDEQYNFFIDLVGVSRNVVELGGPPADDTSFVVLVPCVTDAAAQPTATPTRPSEAAPGDIVNAFLLRVQHGGNYVELLSQALKQRVANGESITTLLGIQFAYTDYMVSPYDTVTAGRATVSATLDGSVERIFTLVQEDGTWLIDGIAFPEVPAPSATPSAAPGHGNTVSFKLNVNGKPCADTTYWGLVGLLESDPVFTQLTDENGDGVYTGTSPAFNDGIKADIELIQGTGVSSAPLAGEVPGAPSRVIADFGTQQPDGGTYRVLNDDFLADASVNGCAAAPSATPAPSATATPSVTATPSATARPSATAKPSVTASATPKPSAPNTLPDTGAGDSMLGGLLAAGAALAASGGYILRRRLR